MCVPAAATRLVQATVSGRDSETDSRPTRRRRRRRLHYIKKNMDIWNTIGGCCHARRVIVARGRNLGGPGHDLGNTLAGGFFSSPHPNCIMSNSPACYNSTSYNKTTKTAEG